MKIISDIHKTTGTNPAPTHVYDPHAKKIYDVETHRHLRKVRDDITAGVKLGTSNHRHNL